MFVVLISFQTWLILMAGSLVLGIIWNVVMEDEESGSECRRRLAKEREAVEKEAASQASKYWNPPIDDGRGMTGQTCDAVYAIEMQLRRVKS